MPRRWRDRCLFGAAMLAVVWNAASVTISVREAGDRRRNAALSRLEGNGFSLPGGSRLLATDCRSWGTMSFVAAEIPRSSVPRLVSQLQAAGNQFTEWPPTEAQAAAVAFNLRNLHELVRQSGRPWTDRVGGMRQGLVVWGGSDEPDTRRWILIELDRPDVALMLSWTCG